jgi:hypothetical protein
MRAALQFAVDVLRPDFPMVGLLALVLAATLTATLAFPLAIGDVFDVIRQHGSALVAIDSEATTAVTGGSSRSPLAWLSALTTSVPGAFWSVFLKLCVCLVLSAVSW